MRDLAAAGGPPRRRHRPLHHLPLEAQTASSAHAAGPGRSTTQHALQVGVACPSVAL